MYRIKSHYRNMFEHFHAEFNSQEKNTKYIKKETNLLKEETLSITEEAP